MLADQLPTALDLMVATLDAGRPPAAAFALVAEVTPAPLGDELGLVGSRLAVGGDPQAVWANLAGDDVLGPLGRAFRRAETSGMPVARVVASVADEMRRERRAARRERSRRVGVRTAAPLGACFLPAFFLIGIVPTIIGVVGTLSFGSADLASSSTGTQRPGLVPTPELASQLSPREPHLLASHPRREDTP